MKKKLNIFFFLLTGIFVILIDQITKQWALANCKNEVVVGKFLTCHAMFNRGVSWSFFHNLNNFGFWILTFFICLILSMLMHYTFLRYKKNYNVFAEVLVISGAISNIIDRFSYNAVVDFIIVHYNDLYFPTFNIADSAITIGVLFILNNLLFEKD